MRRYWRFFTLGLLAFATQANAQTRCLPAVAAPANAHSLNIASASFAGLELGDRGGHWRGRACRRLDNGALKAGAWCGLAARRRRLTKI
jgi:hypothetical protein